MLDATTVNLVIPSLLTILGWFFAAYWAVKQVNLAHDKNTRLQHAIVRQSHRETLARSFIILYLDTARSIAVFTSALGKAGVNMSLDENNDYNSRITFAWRQSLDEVSTAYTAVYVHFQTIRIWLEVHGEQIPNAKEISNLISEFETDFTGGKNNLQGVWLNYQGVIAGIQARDTPDTQAYIAVCNPVRAKIDALWSGLRTEVKQIERHLLNIENQNL